MLKMVMVLMAMVSVFNTALTKAEETVNTENTIGNQIEEIYENEPQEKFDEIDAEEIDFRKDQLDRLFSCIRNEEYLEELLWNNYNHIDSLNIYKMSWSDEIVVSWWFDDGTGGSKTIPAENVVRDLDEAFLS